MGDAVADGDDRGEARTTVAAHEHGGSPPSPPMAADNDKHDADPSHGGGGGGATLRQQVGRHLCNASDVVNDNLIVARYATASTVLLLGAYGIAHTPLFYRYTNVLDMPSKMFHDRKWLHGRIVGLVERQSAPAASGARGESPRTASHWSPRSESRSSGLEQSATGMASFVPSSFQRTAGVEGRSGLESHTSECPSEQRPIEVFFRHSSPMERLLTPSAMDKVVSLTGNAPSRWLPHSSGSNPRRNMIPIEIAGVVGPPSTSSVASNATTGDSLTGQFPLLDQLVRQRTKVKVQLLALGREEGNVNQSKYEVRNFPSDNDAQSTAVCHLHYRQPGQWLATTNVGLQMAENGQAWLGVGDPRAIAKHAKPTARQLRSDASFLARLGEAERAAWTSREGMWSSERARASLRREYAEEEEETRRRWSTVAWSWVRRLLRR